jgi:serine/threonine protein phosphatase PrpC
MLTDVGRLRPHNEDFVDCYVPADREQLEHKGATYLVADGMGGHQAGEVASQGAVEAVIREYYKDVNHEVGTSLVRAFRVANQRIHEQALVDPTKAGMGTTLVAAVILGRKVYIANVGDSRAYLVGKTGIVQITDDHSWVEEQVRAGLLTPEQARRHPQRNLVTRALGSKPSVEVDLFEGQMGKGEALLLCSDGLTSHVEDLEIEAVVREHPPQEATQMLVAKANERGGNDNITVLIVGGRKDMVPAPVVSHEPRRAFPLLPVLAGAAALLVLLAVVAGALFLPRLLGSSPTPTSTPKVTLATPSPVPVEGTATISEPAASIEPTPEEGSAPIGATLTPPGGTAPSGGEGTLEPTETLMPTPTGTVATSTPMPTATQASPTQTRSAATQATPFPAPVLLEPDADALLREKPRFSWRWTRPALSGNHYFDLRIWSQQEEDANATPRGAIEPTTSTQAEIDMDLVPAIQQYGTGDYYWTVVVVQNKKNPKIVGEWGEERQFHYAGPEERSRPTDGDLPPVDIPPIDPLPEPPGLSGSPDE